MTKSKIKFIPFRKRDPAQFTVSVSKGWECFVATCNENSKFTATASTRARALEKCKKNILSYCYKMERQDD